jgi:RpiR family carbohydrate utilization transcriptional regulator
LHLLAAKGSRTAGGQAERLSPIKLNLYTDKAHPTERVGAYEPLLLVAQPRRRRGRSLRRDRRQRCQRMLTYRNAATGLAFERAIDALARVRRKGRRIEFHGVGNSAIVAQDAQHKFFRLGMRAKVCGDGHAQVMSATMLQAGDCAIVISNSGRSRDPLVVADIAHRQGATEIVITAIGSPLARRALQPGHVLLAADHPEDFDRYSPMVSRLLHPVIVDILTTGVALRLGSVRLRPMLQAIKRSLLARRYVEGEPGSR